jgi:hypothetical protein
MDYWRKRLSLGRKKLLREVDWDIARLKRTTGMETESGTRDAAILTSLRGASQDDCAGRWRLILNCYSIREEQIPRYARDDSGVSRIDLKLSRCRAGQGRGGRMAGVRAVQIVTL